MRIFATILLLALTTPNSFAALTDDESDAYLSAAARGKMARFERLDSKNTEEHLRSIALTEAIDGRQKKVLEYLLERYEFSKETMSHALLIALKQNSKDFVRILKAKGAQIAELPQSNRELSDWQKLAVSCIVTAALVGVSWFIDYIIPRYNAWRYGDCTICQEVISEGPITLKCGHHFHRGCMMELLEHIQTDVVQFESWRSTIKDRLTNIPPFLQNLYILQTLAELDPRKAQVYLETLNTGTWCGATFKCPTCRAPCTNN